MISLGICMATRDINCLLCQRHFLRMTADAIFPDEQICDECLAELGQLDGEALKKHVAEQLARRASQDIELEKMIVSAIQRYNQQRIQKDDG